MTVVSTVFNPVKAQRPGHRSVASGRQQDFRSFDHAPLERSHRIPRFFPAMTKVLGPRVSSTSTPFAEDLAFHLRASDVTAIPQTLVRRQEEAEDVTEELPPDATWRLAAGDTQWCIIIIITSTRLSRLIHFRHPIQQTSYYHQGGVWRRGGRSGCSGWAWGCWGWLLCWREDGVRYRTKGKGE